MEARLLKIDNNNDIDYENNDSDNDDNKISDINCRSAIDYISNDNDDKMSG